MKRAWLDRIDPECGFRLLFDGLEDVCFFAKDARGRLMAGNRALLKRFGLEREEGLIGKTDADFLPRSMAEKYRADDLEVMRSERPMRRMVELWVNRQGVASWVVTDKLPVRARGGRVIGVMGTIRDYGTATPVLQEGDELAKALAHLRGHFTEPVSVRELAESSGLSVRQFERRFKAAFRTSPREYLMKMRVHFACERLRLTTQSITAIALESGFYDQSVFTRQFRRHMGITPLRYRRHYED
ncbi:MAG: AraC family transcriptional regulator [Kiritimatiellae bacterium]|nr:AraC family transcriptional regulator [Kiritimatiellia bacterium]